MQHGNLLGDKVGGLPEPGKWLNVSRETYTGNKSACEAITPGEIA